MSEMGYEAGYMVGKVIKTWEIIHAEDGKPTKVKITFTDGSAVDVMGSAFPYTLQIFNA